MSTYATLRDRALDQVGCTGQTEAQTVAQVALEEAMKFVAFHVRIPSLVASATATAPASPELEASAIALTGGASTFGITTGVFQCPDRLYVKKDSTTTGYGAPYEFYEYPNFIDLQSIPANQRTGLYDSGLFDERSRFSYTITPTDKVWAQPLTAGNVLTLFYRKSPAAYSGSATPEITPMFDYMLVNAAVLALKEWLREPAELTTLWALFEQGLAMDIQRYDSFINGRRKRSHLRIHRSYRP
jgi:hypothetical protein